jgi:hypothetical protein
VSPELFNGEPIGRSHKVFIPGHLWGFRAFSQSVFEYQVDRVPMVLLARQRKVFNAENECRPDHWQ